MVSYIQQAFLGRDAAWPRRNCKTKCGTPAGLRAVDPDPATVLFHEPLTDGQSHSTSGILFVRVQALKKSEDLLGILRLYFNAVVGHRENAPAISLLG